MRERHRNRDEVIVIGGGANGLAAAQALHARGIPVRILERARRPGNAWYHRHPQLRLNTHRTLSGLPGREIPKSAGPFPSRDSIIRYLDAYARDLGVPIDYGVRVLRLDRDRDRWSLETDAGAYAVDDVVVATGHARVPWMPDWPGRESFGGELRHAADFGELEHYRGKNILVVGAGNSGADVLNHLSRIETGRVWVSVRHGSVVFPTRLLGLPVQRLSPLMERMPLGVVDRMLALTEFAAFGNLKRWGLRKHPLGGATRLVETGTAPAIDDGFVAALKAGRFTVVPEIERFDSGRVRLADGNAVEPDVVIAATGYRPGLESLLGHLGALDERGVPVTHGAQSLAGYPGLWFIGMRPRLTGFFYMAGPNARETADAIDARRRARDAGQADGAIVGASTPSPPAAA